VREIELYEARNQIRLPYGPNFLKDVAQQIVSHIDVPLSDVAQVASLSVAAAKRYLQRTLRPVTMFDFVETLSRSA
jgi:hypothetical protein